MNYLLQLLPLILALAAFGFACRHGYNKKTLIVSSALSLLAIIPELTSIYVATSNFVINFAILYSLIEGIKWVITKVERGPKCKSSNVSDQANIKTTETHSIKNQINNDINKASASVEMREKKFNVKLFKKIIAIYILFFATLCVFLPMNSYFTGNQVSSGGGVLQQNVEIDLGVAYYPIWEIGSTNWPSQSLDGQGSSLYTGMITKQIKILYLLSELLLLTFLFSGISYILCRKE